MAHRLKHPELLELQEIERLKFPWPIQMLQKQEVEMAISWKSISKMVYEIPNTVSVILKDGAEINKISVAVNVASPAKGEWGATQLSKFEELVKSAVGYVNDVTAGRVDSITVVETKFNNPEALTVDASSIDDVVEQVDYYMDTNIARNVMGGLLLVALLIFYKKIFSSEKIEKSGHRWILRRGHSRRSC